MNPLHLVLGPMTRTSEITFHKQKLNDLMSSANMSLANRNHQGLVHSFCASQLTAFMRMFFPLRTVSCLLQQQHRRGAFPSPVDS